MSLRLSIWRLVVSGLILSGMPLVAIARHLHVESQDIRISVPITISHNLNNSSIKIQTDLNRLDMSELNGPDRLDAGEIVYVHMARGPDRIAYPFALTRHRPNNSDQNYDFAMRAQVTNISDGKIGLRYNFENISPSRAVQAQLAQGLDHALRGEITVKPGGTARITAIEINEMRYPQRVIDGPELEALTQ